jgi:hypothetical protein
MAENSTLARPYAKAAFEALATLRTERAIAILTADKGDFAVEEVCALQQSRVRIIIGDPHGKLRRATLRGRENLTKRQLPGALAHNLSLFLRHLTSHGTAKQWLAKALLLILARQTRHCSLKTALKAFENRKAENPRNPAFTPARLRNENFRCPFLPNPCFSPGC